MIGDRIFGLFRRKAGAMSRHAIRDYRRLVRRKLKQWPDDPRLALAQAIGAPTLADFADWGDRQVAVLRHHGLADGMAIYDFGCGCGRTAQALQRAGWVGSYKGADIIPELVAEIGRTCPGYEAIVHCELNLAALSQSQDFVFHWSVFTHLYPEECYILLMDIFRVLKPGGKLVFSFLEFGPPKHDAIFERNVAIIRAGRRPPHLDQFLHRDWISHFAQRIGFGQIEFTDGNDRRHHPPLGQSIASMVKP